MNIICRKKLLLLPRILKLIEDMVGGSTPLSKGATLLFYYGDKVAKRGRIDNLYLVTLSRKRTKSITIDATRQFTL